MAQQTRPVAAASPADGVRHPDLSPALMCRTVGSGRGGGARQPEWGTGALPTPMEEEGMQKGDGDPAAAFQSESDDEEEMDEDEEEEKGVATANAK